MSKKFEKGLCDCLDTYAPNLNYKIVPEFVGAGGVKEVTVALNKLTGYHDVDLVTGILANKTINEVAQNFKSNVRYHFGNLGEQLITMDKVGDNVAIYSQDMWKEIYALGTYAIEHISNKGAFASSMYDTGYCFYQMLDLAAKKADSQNHINLYISPMPEAKELSDVNVVLDDIERDQPDWVFAAYCGTEATAFIEEWVKRGLHNRITLLGLPFLLEKLENVTSEEFKLITVDNQQAGEIKRRVQTSDVLNIYKVFEAMGSDVAAGIATSLDLKERPNNSIDTSQLKLKVLETSYKIENKHFLNKQLFEGKHLIDYCDNQIQKLMEQPMATWQNPYLAI